MLIYDKIRIISYQDESKRADDVEAEHNNEADQITNQNHPEEVESTRQNSCTCFFDHLFLSLVVTLINGLKDTYFVALYVTLFCIAS